MQPFNYKETFLPDKILFVGELILSALLLGFGTFLVKINSYLASIGQISVQGTVSESFNYFQSTLSSGGIAGRITAAFFWALFGMLMYMAYWAVHNIIANYHNHKVFQLSYVHPNATSEDTRVYHRVVAAKILHIFGIILIPLFAFVLVSSFLPSILNLGVYFTNHWQELSGWWALLAGYGISLVTLHIGFVLSRLGFGEYSVL